MSDKTRYFVSHDGKVKGPFALDTIEAFILSGVYPRDVPICAQGTEAWKKHRIAGTPTPSGGGSPSSAPSSSNGKKAWGWVVIGIATVLVLWAVIAGQRNTPPTRSSSTYSAGSTYSATPRSTPSDNPFSTPASATVPSALSSIPRPTPRLSDEVVYKGSDGRSYRVSNSDYRRLSAIKQGLDEEDAEIFAAQAKIDAHAARVNRERASLDRTSQYAVDSFNAKIDRLNTANDQLQRRVDAFNSRVDAFNTELERVGTPIH